MVTLAYYLIQRDMHIGRTHAVNIGLAATYVEVEGIHPCRNTAALRTERVSTGGRRWRICILCTSHIPPVRRNRTHTLTSLTHTQRLSDYFHLRREESLA